MIYDTVENMSLYFDKDPRFAKVCKAYEDFMKNPVESGRIDIEPEKVWCNVSKYETKLREGAKYESHREFADVQLMVEGEELIGWAPFDECTITDDFKEGGDIAFMTAENDIMLPLRKGYFMVFFPEDAHMPCIKSPASDTAFKLVFKVKL